MLIRFVFYGLLGWIIEILYTGMDSLLRADWRLPGSTYLWMFPVYGMGVFLEPLHARIRHLPWIVRGVIWLGVFWTIEYFAGWLLQMFTGTCPWDYSSSPYAVNGFIRLDMGVQWFVAGLVFERIHDWLDQIMQRLKKPY
ncbi:MAG: hypothetical protein M0Z55_04920 [Peptococcaceae bacterium]|nr:hypothetical protein [Peptococcaceae bacterium]